MAAVAAGRPDWAVSGRSVLGHQVANRCLPVDCLLLDRLLSYIKALGERAASSPGVGAVGAWLPASFGLWCSC